jgi:cell division protein FtsB
MKESLEFYVKLSDDTNKRLAKEIEEHNNEVKALKQENADLKKELKD